MTPNERLEKAREIVTEWKAYEAALAEQGTLKCDEENGVDWFPKSGDLERYRAEGLIEGWQARGESVKELMEALETISKGDVKSNPPGYNDLVLMRIAKEALEGKEL